MSTKVFKKTICLTVILVPILVVILELVPLSGKHQAISMIIDVVELVLALLASILMLALIRHSFLKYVTLGVALALVSWTVGEVFTLSCRHIVGSIVPYPSIADFGYIGFYLMLSSALGILKRVDAADVHKGLAPYLVFSLLLIPTALLFCVSNSPLVNACNFIYVYLNALIIYQAVILTRLKLYRYIIGSAIFIAVVGILFVITVNVFPLAVQHITLMFPVGFAGLLFGILKHNGDQS